MIKIIYEDDDIIILDKPAGVPSASAKNSEKISLADWLIDKYPSQKDISEDPADAGLIHRLDNDTSGIICAAKNSEAWNCLKKQMLEGGSVKKYLALVLGDTPKSGEIDKPIAHDPKSKHKMIVANTALDAKKLKARPAATKFKTIKKFLGGQYSLVEVELTKGARHQVRVHFASIGHPLAGDKLYQNTKQKRLDRTGLVSRHFLHASGLKFRHPSSNSVVEYACDLPGELADVLKHI